MQFAPHNLYHIYNQGNNKQIIFSCREDYLIFLRIIRKNISPYTEIIAYCLMPNHFHFLIYTDQRIDKILRQGGLTMDPLTNGIRKLLSGYARIYNKRYTTTGSLFRQKTKYKCLSNILISPGSAYALQDYYFNCFQYIHQNPYLAGLIKNLGDWEFSSYQDYALVRNGTLCNKELAAKFCSYEPSTFVKTSYGIIGDDLENKLV